jgi:hypothetical protein
MSGNAEGVHKGYKSLGAEPVRPGRLQSWRRGTNICPMPPPDPSSEPWIGAAKGSTLLAVLAVALFVATILDRLASAVERLALTVRDWIDWRDRRRKTEPPVQVVPAIAPYRFRSDVDERLRTGDYPAARPGLKSVALAVTSATATLEPPGLTGIGAAGTGASGRL